MTREAATVASWTRRFFHAVVSPFHSLATTACRNTDHWTHMAQHGVTDLCTTAWGKLVDPYIPVRTTAGAVHVRSSSTPELASAARRARSSQRSIAHGHALRLPKQRGHKHLSPANCGCRHGLGKCCSWLQLYKHAGGAEPPSSIILPHLAILPSQAHLDPHPSTSASP